MGRQSNDPNSPANQADVPPMEIPDSTGAASDADSGDFVSGFNADEFRQWSIDNGFLEEDDPRASYTPTGSPSTGWRLPDSITGEYWGAPAWGIDQTPDPRWENQGPSRVGSASGRSQYDDRRTPQYAADDPIRILNGMTGPELDALERELIRAGYIEDDPDAYSPGGQRSSLIPAFTYVVTYADQNRIDWEQQLDRDVDAYQQWLEENPEETPKTWAQRNPFIAPVYLKPDYATLAQGAKESIRGGLKRSPTSSEMGILTGFLSDAHHDQWKANEYDVAYQDWQNRARGYEAETSVMDGGTVQGVDASSRFAEFYEDRYENELAHRQRVDESQARTGSLFGSIDMLSRMTS